MKDTTKHINAQSLPDLLSAVLRHPDLPTGIRNDLTESLTDLLTSDAASSQFISRAIYGDTPATRFDALASSLIAMRDDEATPDEVRDALTNTIEEIKNRSGALDNTTLEAELVAHSFCLFYDKTEGGAK